MENDQTTTGRRRGPSPERVHRAFNLDRDPLGLKGSLARHRIPVRAVAERAGVAVGTAYDVISGRSRSIYVERAATDLIREARERDAAKA
jgi:hypothetical protein